MASKTSREESKQILEALAKRYPHIFVDDVRYAIPLSSQITFEIVKDLQMPKEHFKKIHRAVCMYQSGSGYLLSVVFSSKKYSLWKNEAEAITLAEREIAKETLTKRGKWNQGLEGSFWKRAFHIDKTDIKD